MKALHILGGLMLVISVGLIEGGSPLLASTLVGVAGCALMVVTMKYTGWYYD